MSEKIVRKDHVRTAALGQEERSLIATALGLALTLILLLVLFGAAIVQVAPELPASIRNVKKLGEIGDFIGGLLNPIIALLALFALIRSIQIQRDELSDTRKALDAQSSIHNRQRLEQTFFELLSLRASAVGSIEWPDPSGAVKQGRGALKMILQEIEQLGQKYSIEELQLDLDYWQVPPNVPSVAMPYVAAFAYRYAGEYRSEALAMHTGFYGMLPNYEPELGHVFRATYQILKFIHKQGTLSSSEKEDLANYLRAQMSEDDFLLFGLTALTRIGRKSRAVSITLDFYQKRLQSIPWAREMLPLFDSKNPDNLAFAATEGFSDKE